MGNSWSGDSDIFYGQHEVEEHLEENESEDKSLYPSTCTKLHRGHRDMILASEFKRDHIPEPYNHIDDIYKLTKALAFLTVRLKIERISEKRPNLQPKTNEEYPLIKNRGLDRVSVGTGRKCDVSKLSGTKCTCNECRDSSEPKTNRYIIKVFTATHVIYDDEEAKDATCTLFHDGDAQSRAIDLRGFKKIWSHDEGDLCLLQTVTCDEKLASTLFLKIKEFNGYWQSLRYMRESKEKEKLVIIVAHPHGGVKRISVGFGVDVGSLMNQNYSKFIYNSPTCPGTSGAPVYVLGSNWFLREFVHSGALRDSPAITQFIRIHSETFSKILPSYETDSAVVPFAFSTLYEDPVNGNEAENDEEIIAQDLKADASGLCRYSNYSARWYSSMFEDFLDMLKL